MRNDVLGNFDIRYIDLHNFIKQYNANREVWDSVKAFFERTDLNSLKDGRYYLDQYGAIVIVQRYITKQSADFELHRKYIDVQYIVDGVEIIEVAKREGLSNKAKAYDFDNDIEFYANAESSIKLRVKAGDLVVFFPSDAHKPCLSDGYEAEVMKIVVKIPFKE